MEQRRWWRVLLLSLDTDGAVDDLRRTPSLTGPMERLLLSLRLCRMGSTGTLVAIHRLTGAGYLWILGPRTSRNCFERTILHHVELNFEVGSWDYWSLLVGEVYVGSKKPLADSFPICRCITHCAMTWTVTSSGETLGSSDGESFDVVEKKSPPAMYTKPATVARDKPLRISMIDDPVWRAAPTSKSVEPQMRVMSALELAQHEVKGHRYLNGYIPCVLATGGSRPRWRLDSQGQKRRYPCH